MNARRPFRGPGSLQNPVESLYVMIFFHFAKDALQHIRKERCMCLLWVESIMMASSNRNIFRVTVPLWGQSTGHRWIPLTKTVMWNFDVFFDLRLNKQLSKHSGGRWFETPSRALWPHCNDGLYQIFVIVTSLVILCNSKACFLTHSRIVTSWNLYPISHWYLDDGAVKLNMKSPNTCYGLCPCRLIMKLLTVECHRRLLRPTNGSSNGLVPSVNYLIQ